MSFPSKQTIALLAACWMGLFLPACGSDGGGGSAPPSSPPATTITGQALKGPFKKGSLVTAIQLGGTGTATTQVQEDNGKYSVEIPWTGLTEIIVTGRYTDEFTGQTSTEPITLAAVGNARSRSTVPVHLNLATTIVAKLVEASLQAAPLLTLQLQQMVGEQEATVRQLVSALLGATTPLSALLGNTTLLPNLNNVLSTVDLGLTGPAAAQLLAFEIVVDAAKPAGVTLNQVVAQFVENIRKGRSFADPVPGIPGVALPDLLAAVGNLKLGFVTLKADGKQVALTDIIANLSTLASVQLTPTDVQAQANGTLAVSLAISPDPTTISPVQAKSLSYNATDIQGKNVSPKPPVLWASSDPTIAIVNLDGRVSGLVPGVVTITASNGSAIKTTATVTVVSEALASISVTPAALTIHFGQQQQFVARATDGAGNSLTGVDFTWASSDETVATIDQTGLAKANQKAGMTTITAANGTITSPGAILSVTPAPPPVPTLSFFSPTSGLAGTIVTIVGTGFSGATEQNLVDFGPLVQEITSATTDKLLVKVPPTAVTGPVTVTSPGGTATSAGTFTANVTNPAFRVASSYISVGPGPGGMAISPDGATLFVANTLTNPHSVSVIDIASKAMAALTGTPPIFFSPTVAWVAAGPEGRFVYLSLMDGYGVLDLGDGSITKHSCNCDAPAQVAVSPDGRRLYVADGANKLVVMNTATHEVIKTYDAFPGGQGLYGVAPHPDGKRVYVTAPNGNLVFVVDTAQDTIEPIPIAVPVGASGPRGVAITPDGSAAYVSLFAANAVAAINTASNAVSAIVPLPSHQKQPSSLAVSPDGKLVYVALTCAVISAACPSLTDTGIVSVIDTTKSPPNASNDIITLNYNAQAIVFSKDGAHAFFTARRSSADDRVFRVQ